MAAERADTTLLVRTYSGRAERVMPWLQRGLGVLLVLSSFYLLAIDKLSPHHLPGLRWISFSVLAAGLMTVLLASRFRRAELVFCSIALVLGLLAIGDIGYAGAVRPKVTTTPK